MQSQRLEARVIEIVEHAIVRNPIEDDRIELKAVWPTDHRNAARQIAGLANAAGGEPILWIVGVDEGAGEVSGADPVEMSSWWAQVERAFDEVAPEPSVLTVAVPGDTLRRVVAIEFTTTRAPYVVKTDGRGQVDREVPWRQGNSTRSAKRSEIIRAVADEAAVPSFTVVYAEVEVQMEGPNAANKHPELGPSVFATAHVQFFVEAMTPVVLPEHLWRFSISVGGVTLSERYLEVTAPVRSVAGGTGHPFGVTQTIPVGDIEVHRGSGAHIRGPGALFVNVNGSFEVYGDDRRALLAASEAIVTFEFPLAMSARKVAGTLPLPMQRREQDRTKFGSTVLP